MSLNSPEFEYNVFIEQDHPATDGHFDGNPLLPGVVTMEHVRIAFEQFKSGMRLKQITKVKNMYPLKPGKTLSVKIKTKNQDTFNFVCIDSDNNQIAAGDFRAELIQVEAMAEA